MTVLLPGPVVVDVAGTSLTQSERERLRHPLTGMVILFTRNFSSLKELAALCDDIHASRPGILISVDHEGGRVQRFREGFSTIPSMGDYGELMQRDELRAREALYAAGFVLAAELRAIGVDYTYAPVLDLDFGHSAVIGRRSFGREPALVVKCAKALLAGFCAAGMANCGKHFPGHGWAQADSHISLPEDERSQEAILSEDVIPYGELSLAAVMTAHVAYRAFGGVPATYCPYLLKTVLREHLGFKGLVFSDDLTMGAVARGDDITQRAQKALAAGCDMVLVCNRPDEADSLLENLSWVRSESFTRRFEGLTPKGTMPSLAALKSDIRYIDACRKMQIG